MSGGGGAGIGGLFPLLRSAAAAEIAKAFATDAEGAPPAPPAPPPAAPTQGARAAGPVVSPVVLPPMQGEEGAFVAAPPRGGPVLGLAGLAPPTVRPAVWATMPDLPAAATAAARGQTPRGSDALVPAPAGQPADQPAGRLAAAVVPVLRDGLAAPTTGAAQGGGLTTGVAQGGGLTTGAAQGGAPTTGAAQGAGLTTGANGVPASVPVGMPPVGDAKPPEPMGEPVAKVEDALAMAAPPRQGGTVRQGPVAEGAGTGPAAQPAQAEDVPQPAAPGFLPLRDGAGRAFTHGSAALPPVVAPDEAGPAADRPVAQGRSAAQMVAAAGMAAVIPVPQAKAGVFVAHPVAFGAGLDGPDRQVAPEAHGAAEGGAEESSEGAALAARDSTTARPSLDARAAVEARLPAPLGRGDVVVRGQPEGQDAAANAQQTARAEPAAPRAVSQALMPAAFAPALAEAVAGGGFPLTFGGAAPATASLVIFNAAMIPQWPPAFQLQGSDAEAALRVAGAELAQMSPEEAAEYLAKMAAAFGFLLTVKKRLTQSLKEEKETLLGLFSFLGVALDCLAKGLQMAFDLTAEQRELLAEISEEMRGETKARSGRGRQRLNL